jgi:tRNA pseudouridine38-40 synthase
MIWNGPRMSRSDVESRLGLNKGPGPGQRRLRLVVAYCGTPWRGWQGLAISGGIQDELAAAVLKATRAETVVHGSGRTDAGVHALAQVAHMDVPVSLRMSDEAWVKSINACLPLSIRIVEVSGAEPTFHSRGRSIVTGSGARNCFRLLRQTGCGRCMVLWTWKH